MCLNLLKRTTHEKSYGNNSRKETEPDNYIINVRTNLPQQRAEYRPYSTNYQHISNTKIDKFC
jgi:hypothetical protein